MRFSPPKWAPTAWLLKTGDKVSADIRSDMIQGLYGTLPIYAGGVANTILVAALVTMRHPSPLFQIWLAGEILICLIRCIILIRDRRAAAQGRPTWTDLYISFGVLWAASVGYGAMITLMSGDWVASALLCLSTAAMVGGICFRNFAAPRLVCTMIFLTMGPCTVGALLSGEMMLLAVIFQIPVYMLSMTIAAFKLNRMLVSTMMAERDNDHRARHDPLTGVANRNGLQRAYEARRAAAGKLARQALFYLDLDGFKHVNDTHGHAAGDELLVQVAGRLNALGCCELVSRIGGDEFILLASGIDKVRAKEISNDIVAALSNEPYAIDDLALPISASVGVALARAGDDLRAAMRRADEALYRSKSGGGRRATVNIAAA